MEIEYQAVSKIDNGFINCNFNITILIPKTEPFLKNEGSVFLHCLGISSLNFY